MVDASFRDLCLDGVDARTLSAFWAAVLGRTVVPENDDTPDVLLQTAAGERSGLTWINQVPERHEVKSRVHLDLRMPVDDPSALVDLGATVLRAPDDSIQWWVMSDPEGNEFCAFGPGPWGDPPKRPEPFEMVVDAADAPAIATWWAERLGGTVNTTDKPWSWIEGAEGFPYLFWVFNPVPEPKTVKNRLHWDVNLKADDPSAFVAAGATVLHEPDPDADWWVLADPEGNEFCAFNAEQA
jgi:hypothetical protein